MKRWSAKERRRRRGSNPYHIALRPWGIRALALNREIRKARTVEEARNAQFQRWVHDIFRPNPVFYWLRKCASRGNAPAPGDPIVVPIEYIGRA